jgi:hypothetical protein
MPSLNAVNIPQATASGLTIAICVRSTWHGISGWAPSKSLCSDTQWLPPTNVGTCNKKQNIYIFKSLCRRIIFLFFFFSFYSLYKRIFFAPCCEHNAQIALLPTFANFNPKIGFVYAR